MAGVCVIRSGRGAIARRSSFDSPADEITPALRGVIARALDHDPVKRFASAYEFADALQSVVPHRTSAPSIANAVITLHGIRTRASWQRAFAEVANAGGLETRLDRWNFGYFSSLHFLLPWSRLAKVRWFRATFEMEFPGAHSSLSRPSIIAHSFGTYILGNALLRYPYLRFHKVLLCGSILPTTFPWDALIERGQIQAVRNEYGTADVWTKLVDWFVPRTGPSGIVGFRATHPRLEQERFAFGHSEYFERGHMTSRWIPFLKRRLDVTPSWSRKSLCRLLKADRGDCTCSTRCCSRRFFWWCERSSSDGAKGHRAGSKAIDHRVGRRRPSPSEDSPRIDSRVFWSL